MLCLCYFGIFETVLRRSPVHARFLLSMSVENLNLGSALDEDTED